MLPLLSTFLTVTFPVTEYNCLVANTVLFILLSEASDVEIVKISNNSNNNKGHRHLVLGSVAGATMSVWLQLWFIFSDPNATASEEWCWRICNYRCVSMCEAEGNESFEDDFGAPVRAASSRLVCLVHLLLEWTVAWHCTGGSWLQGLEEEGELQLWLMRHATYLIQWLSINRLTAPPSATARPTILSSRDRSIADYS